MVMITLYAKQKKRHRCTDVYFLNFIRHFSLEIFKYNFIFLCCFELCCLIYYKQSDLFTEAPQDRGAQTPVNEGECGLRLTVLLCYRFPELVPSHQEMEPQMLSPNFVSLLGRKLLCLPSSS